MAFSEDLSPFFNATEFADAAIVGGVAVNGIFDAAYAGPLSMDGSSPILWVKSASVPTVAQGDSVVVGATNYTVAGIEPDGTGITQLRLQLV